jgi:hypothetical protein
MNADRQRVQVGMSRGESEDCVHIPTQMFTSEIYLVSAYTNCFLAIDLRRRQSAEEFFAIDQVRGIDAAQAF